MARDRERRQVTYTTHPWRQWHHRTVLVHWTTYRLLETRQRGEILFVNECLISLVVFFVFGNSQFQLQPGVSVTVHHHLTDGEEISSYKTRSVQPFWGDWVINIHTSSQTFSSIIWIRFIVFPQYGGLHVEVQLTEGATYITVRQYRDGHAPALLVNYTPYTVNVYEKENVNTR